MTKIHDDIARIEAQLEKYKSAKMLLDCISNDKKNTVYDIIHGIKAYYISQYRVEDRSIDDIVKLFLSSIYKTIKDKLEAMYRKLSVDKAILSHTEISSYVYHVIVDELTDREGTVENVIEYFKKIDPVNLSNTELSKKLSDITKQIGYTLGYEYIYEIHDDVMKIELKDFVNCIREYVNNMEI